MQAFIFRSEAALGALLAILASGCAAHVLDKANSEPSPSRPETVKPIPAGSQGSEAREKAPGVIVYIDPKSGEITPGPSATLPAQRGQQSLHDAREPDSEPQETSSPVPGGGVMIHLGERFSTPLTATIDAEGNLRLEHLSTLPNSGDQK